MSDEKSDKKSLEQMRAELLSAIPEELKPAFLELEKAHRAATMRAAISQVMARNNSHNLGPKLTSKPKPNKPKTVA